jgi:hypothetical protein
MLRQLTAEDYLRVQLATRGESYSHRRWPQEVVRAVAASDLVKAGEDRLAGPRRIAMRVNTISSRLCARLGARRRRGAEGLSIAA